MLYQPNYCCHCGEVVDRIERRLWTSSRFCENCEGDFRKVDWLPRFGFFLALIFGLFGFGSYLRSPDKPLTVTSNQFVASSANKTQTPNSNLTKPVNQANIAKLPVQNLPTTKSLANETATALTKSAPKENQQNVAEEPVYFCGAQTKKGNPCTRKVKGAVRCWQHNGQPALLPKEKLVASK